MVDEQQFFVGGTHAQVVRIGQTMRRPRGPHSVFTKALLDQLQARSVPAPRYLGVDDEGRDVLTFIEGDVRHERTRVSDRVLVSAVAMVKRMHDATAGSTVAGSAEVVCHNDLAPWNLVMRGEDPIAFIDYDSAAPGCRADDIAYFAWTFLELGGDCPVPEQARRLQLVCRTYGLRDGEEIIEAVTRQQQRILGFRERAAIAESDAMRRAFSLERALRIRDEMTWLVENRRELAAAVSSIA